MAIPPEIQDAAKVDGAGRFHMFCHINFPLLGNLYLICTLLTTIFALGDFNAVAFAVDTRSPGWHSYGGGRRKAPCCI